MATAYIKELVNATSSEIVYPVTKSQAVYMSDNSTTVQKAIDDLSALKNVPALDSQTTPNVSDLLTIFRNTNSTGYKALVSDVAKTIIESYQSSSLAGKTQSVKAAFDSLNSRMGDDTAAGFHNSIYRGKNITSYLTDTTLWKRITGTGGYTLFQDLYLGDYITVGSNSYAIVDFDYYLRCGDSDITQHHIVMMPVGNMNIPAGTVLYGTSDTLTFINTANAGQTVSSQESATEFKWNATMSAPNTNTTAGGYKHSRMRTVIMKAANTIVVNAFGSAHVKPIPVLYYSPNDASASGLASGWAWFNSDDQTNIMAKSICDLPNETQIYGQQVWGQGADGNVGYEIGADKFQFAIFALQRNFANTRANYWLRSVHSASSAASVGSLGYASTSGSATALGVRPRFLLVG